MKQILLNLTSNAIKFTENGSHSVHPKHILNVIFHLLGTVTLKTNAKDIPGSNTVELLIDVCDTGVGISDEGQTKLFKPFYQAETSTSRRFGGTGLGLTISHTLAKRMGGNITFKSQLGNGSVFFLRLPFSVGFPSHPSHPNRNQFKTFHNKTPTHRFGDSIRMRLCRGSPKSQWKRGNPFEFS